MTEQGHESEVISAEKQIPIIEGEEDEPLAPLSQLSGNRRKDTDLVETDDIGKEMARFRYKTGRTVLYVAMAAMGAFVLVDLFAAHNDLESDLITSAFEAFKLITMTVLGYFFASNNSNHSQ